MVTFNVSRPGTRLVFALLLLCPTGLDAADALFPSPLHLTRRVTDPISRRAVVVEEYCAGNRVVTLGADRVIVVDYARQDVLEIDRSTATYSVTPFEEVARARAALRSPGGGRAIAPNAESASAVWRGAHMCVAGVSADRFEVDGDEGQKITIAVHRGIELSRGAVEALLGVAYPGSPDRAYDALLSAAAHDRSRRIAADEERAVAVYGLPVEHEVTVSFGDSTVESRVEVLRIGFEPVPPDALVIPPGARQVRSRHVALPDAMREIDSLPPQARP